MTRDEIKSLIDSNIYYNSNSEITADMLNDVLTSLLDNVVNLVSAHQAEMQAVYDAGYNKAKSEFTSIADAGVDTLIYNGDNPYYNTAEGTITDQEKYDKWMEGARKGYDEKLKELGGGSHTSTELYAAYAHGFKDGFNDTAEQHEQRSGETPPYVPVFSFSDSRQSYWDKGYADGWSMNKNNPDSPLYVE